MQETSMMGVLHELDNEVNELMYDMMMTCIMLINSSSTIVLMLY